MDELKSSTLDIELLESLVDSKETTELVDSRKEEINNFIRSKNIVNGTFPVPRDHIYDAYKRWAWTQGIYKYPLSYRVFTKTFKKFFNEFKSYNIFFYKLTRDPFDLPKDYSIYKDPSLIRKIHVKNKKNWDRTVKERVISEGVTYDSYHKVYIVRLTLGEKVVYLGQYTVKNEALEVYSRNFNHFFKLIDGSFYEKEETDKTFKD